jgi:hypothetical protein
LAFSGLLGVAGMAATTQVVDVPEQRRVPSVRDLVIGVGAGCGLSLFEAVDAERVELETQRA